jgi:uncharacterized protein (TIGR00251 family)
LKDEGTRTGSWFRYDPAAQRLTLTLHVQPNARRSEIVGLHGDALKVKIAAPANENKANAELIAFLSGALEVSRAAVAIRHGATGRRKVVEIGGDAALLTRVEALTVDRVTTHDSRIRPST